MTRYLSIFLLLAAIALVLIWGLGAVLFFVPAPISTPSPTATPTSIPSPTPTATPTPGPLSVQLELPSAVAQGGTLAVHLRVPTHSGSGPLSLIGQLDDRPLHFAREGGSYWALGGFPPWATVGPHRLFVQARNQRGEVADVEAQFEVRQSDFRIERIDIPAAREGLRAPEIVQDEFRIVAAIYAEFTPQRYWRGRFGAPLKRLAMSSLYGTARAYDDGSVDSYHLGADLRAKSGDPVLAVASGQVALAQELQVRGNAVILDHGWGVYSNYFHLSSIAVRPGQKVVRGQLIGYVGDTGLSTAPHLHWELRVAGNAVDPWPWTERDPVGES